MSVSAFHLPATLNWLRRTFIGPSRPFKADANGRRGDQEIETIHRFICSETAIAAQVATASGTAIRALENLRTLRTEELLSACCALAPSSWRCRAVEMGPQVSWGRVRCRLG